MTSLPLWNDASSPSTQLDHYEPFGQQFSRAAVLILPGGGYGSLSAQEGEGYAGIFRLQGFHCFVLNYRLGSEGHRHPSMLDDAERAMRFIRSRSEEFGIDPDRIIVIGSSAGGHLAATLLTKWSEGQPDSDDPVERFSSRPDLGILCYPVITMLDHTHEGSRNNLLGDDASQDLRELLSAELQVNTQTPPCFIWHTFEDGAVPVENAILFASALRTNGVPFELHVFEHGGHGLGMKDGIVWTDDLFAWLRRRLQPVA